jgi:hypothetical protein
MSPRKPALPRTRSAPARALERPEHRHRVIPDKRKLDRHIDKAMREVQQRHPGIKITRTEPCHYDTGLLEPSDRRMNDEYDCINQPCILCRAREV